MRHFSYFKFWGITMTKAAAVTNSPNGLKAKTTFTLSEVVVIILIKCSLYRVPLR